MIFDVKPHKLGRVNQERARDFPSVVQRAMKRASRYVIRSLEVRTTRTKKIDRGYLIRGWRGRVGLYSKGIKTTYYNVAKHHPYVELGRKPGNMPPVAKIAAWASRKLGRPDLGWAIAKAIARRGIQSTPILTSHNFQRRAREIIRREILREMKTSTFQSIRRIRV